MSEQRLEDLTVALNRQLFDESIGLPVMNRNSNA